MKPFGIIAIIILCSAMRHWTQVIHPDDADLWQISRKVILKKKKDRKEREIETRHS